MTFAQQASPWRGYINQLTYGIDLAQQVEDEVIQRRADSLVAQRIFSDPVERYYEAAKAALGSGEQLAEDGHQDGVVKDFLARLLRKLDEQHPWPVPPFRTLENDHWSDVESAPVIGRIPLTRKSVEERLSRIFRPVQGSRGEQFDVLVLRLRSGDLVGLIAPVSFSERGVSVRAYGDQSSILASIREFTGLDVETE